MSVYDVLLERGFIEQVTGETEIRELLEREPVTCYIGFDPTAASLHIGSLVPIMALAHMQRHHHRPIALVGGGTGLIGDPSGRRRCDRSHEVRSTSRGVPEEAATLSRFQERGSLLLNNAD